MKIAVLLLFGSLCIACSKQPYDCYNVSIVNNYFEAIDSLLLDGVCSYQTLLPGDTAIFYNVSQGTHHLSIHTSSLLMISNTLYVNGKDKTPVLTINDRGLMLI